MDGPTESHVEVDVELGGVSVDLGDLGLEPAEHPRLQAAGDEPKRDSLVDERDVFLVEGSSSDAEPSALADDADLASLSWRRSSIPTASPSVDAELPGEWLAAMAGTPARPSNPFMPTSDEATASPPVAANEELSSPEAARLEVRAPRSVPADAAPDGPAPLDAPISFGSVGIPRALPPTPPQPASRAVLEPPPRALELSRASSPALATALDVPTGSSGSMPVGPSRLPTVTAPPPRERARTRPPGEPAVVRQLAAPALISTLSGASNTPLRSATGMLRQATATARRERPRAAWLAGSAAVGALLTVCAMRVVDAMAGAHGAPVGLVEREPGPSPTSVTTVTNGLVTVPTAPVASSPTKVETASGRTELLPLTVPSAATSSAPSPVNVVAAPPRPVGAPSTPLPLAAHPSPAGAPSPGNAGAAAAAPVVAAAPVTAPAPARPVMRAAPSEPKSAPLPAPAPRKRVLTPEQELAEAQLKASMR